MWLLHLHQVLYSGFTKIYPWRRFWSSHGSVQRKSFPIGSSPKVDGLSCPRRRWKPDTTVDIPAWEVVLSALPTKCPWTFLRVVCLFKGRGGATELSWYHTSLRFDPQESHWPVLNTTHWRCYIQLCDSILLSSRQLRKFSSPRELLSHSCSWKDLMQEEFPPTDHNSDEQLYLTGMNSPCPTKTGRNK